MPADSLPESAPFAPKLRIALRIDRWGVVPMEAMGKAHDGRIADPAHGIEHIGGFHRQAFRARLMMIAIPMAARA